MRIIYGFKMLLLWEEFGLSPEQVHALKRMLHFFLHLYPVPWFTAHFASNAAFHDLRLFKRPPLSSVSHVESHISLKILRLFIVGLVENFRSFSHIQLLLKIRIDAEIADTCLVVMERQSWWLGECLIFLTLLSSLVSDDEKSAVAAALLKEKPATPIEPGKTDFPLLRPNLAAFKDLVGPQSWVFFHHLEEIDREKQTEKWSTSWLTKPPTDWPKDDALQAKVIVDSLHGVNDCAERGCRTAELFKVIFFGLQSSIPGFTFLKKYLITKRWRDRPRDGHTITDL